MDCGSSKTACSKEWLNYCPKICDKNSQQYILREQSNYIYCFGDSRKIKVIHSAPITPINYDFCFVKKIKLTF